MVALPSEARARAYTRTEERAERLRRSYRLKTMACLRASLTLHAKQTRRSRHESLVVGECRRLVWGNHHTALAGRPRKSTPKGRVNVFALRQ